MKSIDALGPRPERRRAFTRDLLAETSDAELQRVVEQAARDLSTPIALVTLVLDQIQFFKAHYGLPADLAATRGTSRDVSFCQFVVRDEEAIEINDARDAAGIPQHVVDEYDIRAYLGMPLRAGDVVVGSLCVLDTEPREFTDAEREGLSTLAEAVNERIATLTEDRRQTRLALTEATTGPGIAELQQSLMPIVSGVEAGFVAMPAIRSFLDASAHALEGGKVPPESMKQMLQAAREAIDSSEDALYDIEVAAADCADCVVALEALTAPATSTRLSEVLTAAQDLARQSTRSVGGAPLPDLPVDPIVYITRPLAVALVASALMAAANCLAETEDTNGLTLHVQQQDDTVELGISAQGLSAAAASGIAARLRGQLNEDPTVQVADADGTIRLVFKVVI